MSVAFDSTCDPDPVNVASTSVSIIAFVEGCAQAVLGVVAVMRVVIGSWVVANPVRGLVARRTCLWLVVVSEHLVRYPVVVSSFACSCCVCAEPPTAFLREGPDVPWVSWQDPPVVRLDQRANSCLRGCWCCQKELCGVLRYASSC